MLSESPKVASRPSITCESVSRFAELVKKIETSPSPATRRWKSNAQKRLKCVVKEQRRYAKVANLRAVALTLTYRETTLFSPKHISTFLDRLRRELKKMGHIMPYAWTQECARQLHYHLILWLPRNYALNTTKLLKWWSWGSTWVEGCRCITAWTRYISKFDSKTRLPVGARHFGYGGLDSAGKLAASRSTLPRWLLTILPASHSARRSLGGGWADRVTGEIYYSPYVWTPYGHVLSAFASPPLGVGVSATT